MPWVIQVLARTLSSRRTASWEGRMFQAERNSEGKGSEDRKLQGLRGGWRTLLLTLPQFPHAYVGPAVLDLDLKALGASCAIAMCLTGLNAFPPPCGSPLPRELNATDRGKEVTEATGRA